MFYQVTFFLASTAMIWPSWPTARPLLCSRLRQLSPRWFSVSSRPSPRTWRRTLRLTTRMNWTLWTTHETTPSTGRHCGRAGWDYRGRDSFSSDLCLSNSSACRWSLCIKSICCFSHMHWCRDIVLQKTNNESWGFSIVGGYEESHGQQPFFIKTIVPGTPAHFDGRLK